MIGRRSIADLEAGDILLDHNGRELGAFVEVKTVARDPYAPWAGQRLVAVTVRPAPPARPFAIRYASVGDVVSIRPAGVTS